MVLASPQFTPAQLIESGRRAEAEGRFDLAVQFYGHLAEHFAGAAEAAEARGALGRIAATQSHARLWGALPQAGPARAHRHRPPDRRRHYRMGRGLAALLSAFGWLLALAGLAALPVYVLMGAGLRWIGLLPMAGGAAGLFIVGSGVALAGQIARALFDQATATRDLLALERAKLDLD